MRTSGCAVSAAGRRPSGLLAGAAGDDTLASYFTECAWLEAASVIAFEELAAALADLAAPPELVDRCMTASVQEQRHEEASFALARRFGATERRPIARARARSLTPFELARENVVEGVVLETFGAAVATFRAVYARDDEARAVMTTIAREECEHAELAASLETFFDSLLTPAERRAVAEHREIAIRELRATFTEDTPAALYEIAGVPTGRSAPDARRAYHPRLGMTPTRRKRPSSSRDA